MKEVFRKEVVKMLQVGMIYPISDRKWVSPVQVVPKKGGMTVIRNDKNKLIPTRAVSGWMGYSTRALQIRKGFFEILWPLRVISRLGSLRKVFPCLYLNYMVLNEIYYNYKFKYNANSNCSSK
ncbi:PREDICTED: uncharacterized protein LOC109341594 [Lupinus angustifolius]|uniref:uncharacterized protein LOC109341594 n=1 Tax=Lupinus angustifolius TaxID=3871 RepID=UPI00092EC57C|nr:PREDICTED: uncharacterized protein LOC109341594 [Lupinus angustifolius]